MGFIALEVFCQNPAPSAATLDEATIKETYLAFLNNALHNYSLELSPNGTLSAVVKKQDEDDELVVIQPQVVSDFIKQRARQGKQ
jgi:hypothetical protein